MLNHITKQFSIHIPAKRHGEGKDKKVNFHLVAGSSAFDFADWIAKNHPDKAAGVVSPNSKPNNQSWDFGAGFSGVADLCKTGWTCGTHTICDFSDKIREAHKKNAKYSRQTSGLFFDVADVLAGVPECYFYKNEKKETREIQLNISITGAYDVPADTLHNRGAAILALVQTLQAENWRVKLSLYCALLDYPIGGNDKKPGYTICRIDLDTRPLDVSELSLILAHPGFMRRICLATAETTEQNPNLGGYGGGTLKMSDYKLRDFSDETKTQILQAAIPASENSLNFLEYVTKSDTQFNTPESAAKWVQNQLDTLVRC